MIFERTNESTKFIQKVARNRIQSIAKVQDFRIRTAGVSATLSILAIQYGARKQIHSEVLKECTTLVLSKFSRLALDDLKEAYRQFAAGEISPKGAEMYGGEFNATQVGKILAAYCKRRDEINRLIINVTDAHREKQEQQKRAEEMRQNFIDSMPDKIKKLQNQNTNWQEVPDYWWDYCKSNALFELDDEGYQHYWNLAQIAAKKEHEKAIAEESDRMNYRQLLAKKDHTARAKVIARQMVICDLVINFKCTENNEYGEDKCKNQCDFCANV